MIDIKLPIEDEVTSSMINHDRHTELCGLCKFRVGSGSSGSGRSDERSVTSRSKLGVGSGSSSGSSEKDNIASQSRHGVRSGSSSGSPKERRTTSRGKFGIGSGNSCSSSSSSEKCNTDNSIGVQSDASNRQRREPTTHSRVLSELFQLLNWLLRHRRELPRRRQDLPNVEGIRRNRRRRW